MIDLTLALELRDAGLAWKPAPGDRFVITTAEMVDELFFLADMVIEPRHLESGTILTFNGTTEWALDSVDQDKTLWLPNEGQLRAALGTRFRSLRCDDAFEVSALVGDAWQRFRDRDAENAYGHALLAALRAEAE